MRLLLTTLWTCCCLLAYGQNADSLWGVWNDTAQPDSSRLQAMNDLAWSLLFTQPDSAYQLAQLQYDFAINIADTGGQAGAYNVMGISFWVRGDFPQALSYYEKSIPLKAAIGDKKGLAGAYNNIGAIYSSQGNAPLALEYYLKSLTLKEELNDKVGMAASYNNIGLIYRNREEFVEAEDYLNRALVLREELGDESKLAMAYTNMGGVYLDQRLYEQANAYYNKAQGLYEKLEDIKGVAVCLENKGLIHKYQYLYDEALPYFEESHQLRQQINDPKMLAMSAANYGSIFNAKQRYQQALELCEEGLRIAREIQVLEEEKLNCHCLSEAYVGLGNHQQALHYFKQYVAVRDSMINERNIKEITGMQLKFEFDKEQYADSLNFAQQQQEQAFIHEQEVGRQKTYTYLGIVGFVIMLILAALIWRGYTLKQQHNRVLGQKNEQLHEKNQIIEEKNRDITRSIEYAQKLQNAILPSSAVIQQTLPQHFVLWLPRDIVSGDFYWFHEKEDTIFIAAADCTGHGVPGAFVSLTCHNIMNKVIVEQDLNDPGQILSEVNKGVHHTFLQEGTLAQANDGMDIALLAIQKDFSSLHYAGAMNSLVVVRNGEAIITKANRRSIGGHTPNDYPFTTHTIPLQQHDGLYIYSDGFSDQFGGEDFKKFKQGRLIQLLEANASKSMEDQKEVLHQTYLQWRGDIEQLDDICIIGIRV